MWSDMEKKDTPRETKTTEVGIKVNSKMKRHLRECLAIRYVQIFPYRSSCGYAQPWKASSKVPTGYLSVQPPSVAGAVDTGGASGPVARAEDAACEGSWVVVLKDHDPRRPPSQRCA